LKKVFIDECVDWRLLRSLAPYEVKTAKQMGWSELKNGKLLREASVQFDVFLSTDSGIEHQNNIASINIAVVILEPRRNKLSELLPLLPRLLEILPGTLPGTVTRVAPENQLDDEADAASFCERRGKCKDKPSISCAEQASVARRLFGPLRLCRNPPPNVNVFCN
jgi:hypothetical protein